MELNAIIPEVLAWSYLWVGISIFLHRQFWAEMLVEISDQKSVLILFGFFFLPFGLLIVKVHNVWVLSPLVVITLLGWAMIIKSIAWLVFPHQIRRLVPSVAFISKWIVIDSCLFIGFSAWILFVIYAT